MKNEPLEGLAHVFKRVIRSSTGGTTGKPGLGPEMAGLTLGTDVGVGEAHPSEKPRCGSSLI